MDSLGEASQANVAIAEQRASQWETGFSLLKMECVEEIDKLQDHLNKWTDMTAALPATKGEKHTSAVEECVAEKAQNFELVRMELQNEMREAEMNAGECGFERENAEVARMDASNDNSIVAVSKFAQISDGLKLMRDMGELQARVKELMNSACYATRNPQLQAAAVGAAGGGVVLGAGGAVSGLVTGGVVGAAVGLPVAPFTLGLSVPISAMVGSGTGLCVGTAVGGTSGVVGGGAAGYGATVLMKNYREHLPRMLQRIREMVKGVSLGNPSPSLGKSLM